MTATAPPGMPELLHEDFTRLAAWDALRGRFLGLVPDPLDRTGRGFRHG